MHSEGASRPAFSFISRQEWLWWVQVEGLEASGSELQEKVASLMDQRGAVQKSMAALEAEVWDL